MSLHKQLFSSERTIAIILTAIVVLSANILLAADAGKIIKKMQKKYRSAKTITIDFKEISRFSLTGTSSEIHGTLRMQGKDKFRLDSEDQVLLNDTETFWKFNKIENQVLIDYAKQGEQEQMLNSFLYEIDEHYYGQVIREDKVDGKKKYLLKLTPKPSEQSFFTSIELRVVDKTWEIERVVYRDYNDNETEFIVEKMEFNPTFSSETFSFNPPEGTQVVDLRF